MTAPRRPGTGDRPTPATGAGRTATQRTPASPGPTPAPGAGRTEPRQPETGAEARPDAYSPGMPRSQIAVRTFGATAVVLAVALGGAPPELLIVVVGAATFAAIRPEPIGAALSLVAVILACLGAGPEIGSWAALAPALGLLVEHTCLVVVAGAPPRAHLPARLLVRAALRSLAVGAITTAVWAVLNLAPHGLRTPPLIVVAALGLLFAAAYVLCAPVLPAPEPAPSPEPTPSPSPSPDPAGGRERPRPPGSGAAPPPEQSGSGTSRA